MTPRILRAHQEGHKRKLKEQDRMNWIANQYTCSAIAAVLSDKSKYIEEPLLSKDDEPIGNIAKKQVFEMKQRMAMLKGLPESPK